MEEVTVEDQENIIVINDSNSEECFASPIVNEETTVNHEEITGNVEEKQMHTNIVLEESSTLIKNSIKQLIVDRVTKHIEMEIINDQNDIEKEYNRYLSVKKQKLNGYVIDLQQKINSDNDTMTTIKSSLEQSNGLIQFLNQQIENIKQRKFDNKNRLEIIKTKFSNQQKQEDLFLENNINKKNKILDKFEEDKNKYENQIDNDQEILTDYKKQLQEICGNINDLKQTVEATENQIIKQLEEKQIIEEKLLKMKNNLCDSCLEKEKELQVQNGTIVAITNQIEPYKEKLPSFLDKIRELKDTERHNKNTIDDLEGTIEDLLKIYGEKHQKVDEIRLSIENTDESFTIDENDYKRCLQEKETELNTVGDELAISQELYNKQAIEIDTFEEAIAEKLKIKDSLVAELDSCQSILTSNYKTLAQLKEEQTTKQEILQDLQKHKDQLEDKLKKLNEEIIKQQNYNDEQTKIYNTKLEILIRNNNQMLDHLTSFKYSKTEKSQQLDMETKEILPVLKKSEETVDDLMTENNQIKLMIQRKMSSFNQLRSTVKKLSKSRYRLSMNGLSKSLTDIDVSATRKVRFDETVHIKSATEESDSQDLSQPKENSSDTKNLEQK